MNNAVLFHTCQYSYRINPLEWNYCIREDERGFVGLMAFAKFISVAALPGCVPVGRFSRGYAQPVKQCVQNTLVSCKGSV